jgi:hypothetical protein
MIAAFGFMACTVIGAPPCKNEIGGCNLISAEQMNGLQRRARLPSKWPAAPAPLSPWDLACLVAQTAIEPADDALALGKGGPTPPY